MNLIVGKSPLEAGKAEIIDMISSKTGLKSQDILLIFDAFSFFIRKKILEDGCAFVSGVGKFYVVPKSINLCNKRYNTVKFYPSDDFRERIKGTNKKLITFCAPFVEQLKIVSKMFGLKQSDTKFIFKYYFTIISIILKKYKTFRLYRIGTFKLEEKPFLGKSGITKQWDYNEEISCVEFKISDSFFRETNKQTSVYNMNERLQQMLYLVGVGRNINRKEYNINHDYKKDKGF
jgi:nucleoid DNA-binding protein